MELSQGGVVADEMHVAALMFIAYRSSENRILDAVRRAGFDMTLAQARIAARIGPDGTRLTDLAEQAQVTKQTATHLVDELERNAYVERTVDPTDGRGRLVRYTRLGLKVIEAARVEEEKITAEWTRHVGERRMRQLRETLTLLREITDPYA
jgi:DNA-binding MarR family transcriptional regulator